MSEVINDTETEYASVEGLLNMHRTVSNITNLISDIPNINNEEDVIIALGQRKKTASILIDEVYIEQAFPNLLSKSKFGYNTFRDIPLSLARYFNQKFLIFNQYFASDADYLLFAADYLSVYE